MVIIQERCTVAHFESLSRVPYFETTWRLGDRRLCYDDSYSGRYGHGVLGHGGYENLFNALRTSVELDGCSEKVFRVTRAKLIRILGGKEGKNLARKLT